MSSNFEGGRHRLDEWIKALAGEQNPKAEHSPKQPMDFQLATTLILNGMIIALAQTKSVTDDEIAAIMGSLIKTMESIFGKTDSAYKLMGEIFFDHMGKMKIAHPKTQPVIEKINRVMDELMKKFFPKDAN